MEKLNETELISLFSSKLYYLSDIIKQQSIYVFLSHIGRLFYFSGLLKSRALRNLSSAPFPERIRALYPNYWAIACFCASFPLALSQSFYLFPSLLPFLEQPTLVQDLYGICLFHQCSCLLFTTVLKQPLSLIILPILVSYYLSEIRLK